MRLFHATTRRNYDGIMRDERIRTDKAQDKRKAVWLHTASRSAWAVVHTVRRHGGRVEDVVILEINLPRRSVRRGHKCLWYTMADVTLDAIVNVSEFRAYSRSPIRGTA